MVSAEAFARFGFPLFCFVYLSLPGGLESHSLHDTAADRSNTEAFAGADLRRGGAGDWCTRRRRDDLGGVACPSTTPNPTWRWPAHCHYKGPYMVGATLG